MSESGHVFLSYVREDAAYVDRLQQLLQDAGIRVWRDTADLWPGQDWRAQIRRAINGDALVFLVCFSRASVSRVTSYQNEELNQAIDQLRQRNPDHSWLIPVRFDDCQIPDREIGGGRMLSSIQRADLFGEWYEHSAERLVQAIRRLLGPDEALASTAAPASLHRPVVNVAIAAPDASDAGFHPLVRSVVVVTTSGQIGDLAASYVTDQDRGGTTGLGHAPVQVSTGVWRIRSDFELRSLRDVIIGYTTVTAGEPVQWFQWDGYHHPYDRTSSDTDASHLNAFQQIKEARQSRLDANGSVPARRIGHANWHATEVHSDPTSATGAMLEVTKVGFTPDAEFDVMVRNLGDVDLIIHQISITKLGQPEGIVFPALNPTARYHVAVDAIPIGDTRSISVSHVVPARKADRFLIALHATAVCVLQVTLHYNKDQEASFKGRTWRREPLLPD